MSFLRRCKVNPQTAKLLEGLKNYCTRMLAQATISRPLELNVFLHTPKTIVEIAEAKGIRNLKLLELVLETLTTHDILRREGAKYKWQGYDFKVTDNEHMFATQSSEVSKFLSALAENLPRTLEGNDKNISFPLVVLDAICSSFFFNTVSNQILTSMNELFPEVGKPEVIVDLFSGAGWSTIHLAETFQPKKIYAVEPRSPRLLPIAQENISILLDDPMATAIEFLPVSLMESPIREDVDLIFGLMPYQWTLPSDWLQLTERIYTLLNDNGFVAGFQLMRDQSTPKGTLPIEPLLAGLPQFTMLPQADNVHTMLMEAGFLKPVLLCNSFFFSKKQISA